MIPFQDDQSPIRVMSASDLLAMAEEVGNGEAIVLDAEADEVERFPDPQVEEILEKVIGRGVEGQAEGAPLSVPNAEGDGNLPVTQELNDGFAITRDGMSALQNLGGPLSLQGFIDDVTSNPANVPTSGELENLLVDILRRA